MALEYVSTGSTAVRERRRDAADIASFIRGLDWVLIGVVGGLVAYGLWAIDGITGHDIAGNPGYYVVRQGVFVAVGALVLVAAVAINPDWYRRRWRAIFIGTAFVIAIVFVAGPVTRGSKRWLDLGFFRFQPSEFGKVLFVLALAGFLAERTKRLNEARTTLQVVGLACVPILLVFLQPDIGTALVYAAALGAILFVAGARWTHLAALGACVVLVAATVLWIAPAAGVHILRPYQVQRFTGFVHPNSDPGGATYNIVQSKNAIGAGELRGRGPNGATQTTLHFLPEHHTDFVFASLSEERGFVGASILLGLYLLLIWRGLRIVALARDAFSAIVAGAIVFALLFEIFINVGMTMGIAPITGIPLPFLSVGGSAMIANLAAVGILLAIQARARPGRR
ncbi:MAG TPA: rod shape-determining protein RodA [Gaiellaceae bacterium]|jgi:rod shape determining protein RodA|nr:rod shape-determining protein RodA [Gaiellaceae bacterium]